MKTSSARISPSRLDEITARYAGLRLAVVGDFCLDRYFDIDPGKAETSLETGLPVHNIVAVRCQPGAAGTILNNLVGLSVGEIHAIGFCGADGEGWELLQALRRQPGVKLDHFVQSPEVKTFTYTKPLVHAGGKAPVELSRLDIKNWSPTPAHVEQQLIEATCQLFPAVDALILLDQVDVPETGVVTRGVLAAIGDLLPRFPTLPILADSRRGLRDFPPVIFKMNARELGVLTGRPADMPLEEVAKAARELACANGSRVFVTLAERGMLGALPSGEVEQVPAFLRRGEIDIVGAGDAVTANLTLALAAGATLRESLELASAAASIVIHQLGTTGTATVAGMARLLVGEERPPPHRPPGGGLPLLGA